MVFGADPLTGAARIPRLARMRFSFLHAADLHIDSPLQALGRKNAEAAARFAAAGRKAVTALIDETLSSGAKFLIIAGDIFDGDWADYSTGQFFIREMARLERAGIPVFIVRGNHDAANKMSRSLRWPDNVKEFSARKAETFDVPDLPVVLHGRSFADRSVPDDFVSTYPARRDGRLNIGVLHTSLNGKPGHDPYAPCSEDDLRRFAYDYWALGHIHKPEIVSRDPWIVYPGNIQGRSVRETGMRGAVRVEVDDTGITSTDFVALDAARWDHANIDISSCTNEDDVLSCIASALKVAHDDAAGRELALRLSITGQTPLHDMLSVRIDDLEEEARALAARQAETIWIEALKLKTVAPGQQMSGTVALDGLDIENLLRESASDPSFAASLQSLAADIRNKLPRELQDEFDNDAGTVDPEGIVQEAQSLLLGRVHGDAAE